MKSTLVLLLGLSLSLVSHAKVQHQAGLHCTTASDAKNRATLVGDLSLKPINADLALGIGQFNLRVWNKNGTSTSSMVELQGSVTKRIISLANTGAQSSTGMRFSMNRDAGFATLKYKGIVYSLICF